MGDASLYFAYGSNINLEQMAYRCPDASVVGLVFLDNYELLSVGIGMNVLCLSKNAKVGAV